MELLRSHLSRVRIPEPTNRIYKNECCISFDTPRSEGGLFVDMSSFLAFGKDYVPWNYEKTGDPVYLHIQQKKKVVPEDRPLKKPTLLAIGVEGGFDSQEPEYEETRNIVILPDYVTLSFPSVELPEKVRLAVDAILMAEGVERREQLAAWTSDKKRVSAYATNLQQIDNGVVVPPSGWKCCKCEKTDNLWLNLTDGMIFCGRRNWDGTGGNNHAIEHYEETKYPLAVKLGTITADLEGADVFSYPEDESVEDPLLAQHLAFFGIDFSSLQKTEMTTAERELDQNTNFDWNRIQESGQEVEPLYGPGYTGLVNLGNSCYMASVMQVIFSTHSFISRYFDRQSLKSTFENAPADPTIDLNTQLTKLGHGLLSGKYSFPAQENGELGFLCLDKWKRSGEIGLQLKEERRLPRQKSRHLVKISSREPPSVRYPKKDKQRSLSCKFADFIFPGISSSYSGKTLPRRLSKRRGASSQRSSMNLESDEEVQHIVLLDDEDIHPVHSIESGNTSDDRQDYTIYYPSRDDPECVELSYSDLKCLGNESYLSSPVMNFYIQYLQRSPCHMAKLKGDCYVFNTYFYSKLEAAITCKDDRTTSFLKLRRWWKGVDIFRKTYIFLPIHADMHWSLVIIYIPANEDEPELRILHLDSLGLHASSHIFSVVARYLVEEWNCTHHIELPQNLPISRRSWKYFPWRIEKEKITVPQQKNEYDCGLFVLYFMQRFIEEAPERLRKEDLSMFGKNWFDPDEASQLRGKVKELLTNEFESNMLECGIQASRAYMLEQCSPK